MTSRHARANVPDRGFTLVEILIGIVLVGILGAVVVVGVSSLTSTGGNAACDASVDAARTALVAHQTTTGVAPTSFDDLVASGSLQLQSGVTVDASGMRLLGSTWQLVLRGGAVPAITCAAGTQALPLDVNQPLPAAAYGLRRLTVTWSGPAVRVRRSSDGGERDIGLAADGSLDTVALLDFVGVGADGSIATWYDQSGNGRHAVQAAPLLQPAIVVAGVLQVSNGKPALSFDGLVGGQMLSVPTFRPGAIGTWTVAATRRTQTSDPASCCRPLVATDNSAWGAGIHLSAARSDVDASVIAAYWQLGWASAPQTTWPVGSTAVLSLSFDGTTHVLGVNASSTTLPGGGPMNGSVSIGGEPTYAARRFAGSIGEVLLFERALTAPQLASITADAARWFGVTIS